MVETRGEEHKVLREEAEDLPSEVPFHKALTHIRLPTEKFEFTDSATEQDLEEVHIEKLIEAGMDDPEHLTMELREWKCDTEVHNLIKLSQNKLQNFMVPSISTCPHPLVDLQSLRWFLHPYIALCSVGVNELLRQYNIPMELAWSIVAAPSIARGYEIILKPDFAFFEKRKPDQSRYTFFFSCFTIAGAERFENIAHGEHIRFRGITYLTRAVDGELDLKTLYNARARTREAVNRQMRYLVLNNLTYGAILTQKCTWLLKRDGCELHVSRAYPSLGDESIGLTEALYALSLKSVKHLLPAAVQAEIDLM